MGSRAARGGALIAGCLAVTACAPKHVEETGDLKLTDTDQARIIASVSRYARGEKHWLVPPAHIYLKERSEGALMIDASARFGFDRFQPAHTGASDSEFEVEVDPKTYRVIREWGQE